MMKVPSFILYPLVLAVWCVVYPWALVFIAAKTALQFLFKRSYHDAKGKHIFVTGCDTGFGNMVAKRLDALGAHVYAGCLTSEAKEALSKECSSRLIAFRMDVTSEEDVKEAAEMLTKACGDAGLWGVVNNAGINRGVLTEVTTMDEFRKVMEVNYFGMVAVSKAIIPLVRKAKGRIVNITSIAGSLSSCHMTAYTASKHAAEAFSKALQVEMQPFGVHVSIVAPGFMKTPIVTTAKDVFVSAWKKFPEVAKRYGDKYVEKLLEQATNNPFAGDPKQVEDALVHALLGKWPKMKYWLGNDAWLLFRPMVMLPHQFNVWLSNLVDAKPANRD